MLDESAQPTLFPQLSFLAETLSAAGGAKCSGMDLYSDMFRLGEHFIQTSTEVPGLFKTNPIIIGHDGKRMHRKILFEDTFEQTLDEFSGYEWCFVSGCTYWGRVNSAERQSKLYALIFDLDGVSPSGLRNFFSAANYGIYPFPNYIVESGHGLHLYYVLDEPVDLYPNIKTQLKNLKYGLTRVMWNQHTSSLEHVQYQGINQGFRVPGSRTKIPGVTVQAWTFNRPRISIEALGERVEPKDRVVFERRYPKGRMSLEVAKAKYPEWYERVVVNGEHDRGQWVVKPALYEWWLNKLRTGTVTYGHRYFCVMALAIYAAKCGIYDVERVRADALSLVKLFTSINNEHPFTKADIDSALECLDARYTRFPRRDIEKLTNITIPPNKRNGRTLEQNMQIVNGLRKMRRDALGEDEYRNAGRPLGSPNKKHPKRDAVLAYRASHPGVSQREIAAALGVSKTTVNKWLNS